MQLNIFFKKIKHMSDRTKNWTIKRVDERADLLHLIVSITTDFSFKQQADNLKGYKLSILTDAKILNSYD